MTTDDGQSGTGRTTASTAALRVGVAALAAQLALQFAWHAWLAPTSRAALAIAVFPLLPPLWICSRNLRRGVLVGGIVNLFYFCHGIAEWWNPAGQHAAGTIEVLVCLTVIGAISWDARGHRRPAK